MKKHWRSPQNGKQAFLERKVPARNYRHRSTRTSVACKLLAAGRRVYGSTVFPLKPAVMFTQVGSVGDKELAGEKLPEVALLSARNLNEKMLIWPKHHHHGRRRRLQAGF